MKSIRMVMLFLIMVTLLRLLAGCGGTCDCPPYVPTHYVDVYVNDLQKFVTLEDDKEIKEIYLFPDDVLFINNLTDDEVKVVFPDGMFEPGSAIIKPNKRARFKALKAGPVNAGLTSTKDDNVIDGTPKVRVGEGP